MRGVVERGVNNIFTVRCEEGRYLCRIKGKVLADSNREYNPLAVGDLVDFMPVSDTEGLITARAPRRNCFQRWNPKGDANQTIVANTDLVVCVCSTQSPPFRPNFVDRVIACSRNVPVLILLNKCDQTIDEQSLRRLELYRGLGFQVLSVSALTGEGLDGLHSVLRGKTAAFVGQSGVGKSSLVNALTGTVRQKTGDVSEKYNRGKHTTTASAMIDAGEFTIIDTPGVREFSVWHDDPLLLQSAFPEFAAYSPGCLYPGCLHDSEPDCAVKKAVDGGLIDPDRYGSYLRILDSLKDEKVPLWQRRTKKEHSNAGKNSQRS